MAGWKFNFHLLVSAITAFYFTWSLGDVVEPLERLTVLSFEPACLIILILEGFTLCRIFSSTELRINHFQKLTLEFFSRYISRKSAFDRWPNFYPSSVSEAHICILLKSLKFHQTTTGSSISSVCVITNSRDSMYWFVAQLISDSHWYHVDMSPLITSPFK